MWSLPNIERTGGNESYESIINNIIIIEHTNCIASTTTFGIDYFNICCVGTDAEKGARAKVAPPRRRTLPAG